MEPSQIYNASPLKFFSTGPEVPMQAMNQEGFFHAKNAEYALIMTYWMYFLRDAYFALFFSREETMWRAHK